MPYHGEWLVPLRVIGARAWGVMTMDDVDKHTALCVRLLTEAQAHASDNLVYYLFNVLEVESMPPIYLTVSRSLPLLQFKNRGPMFYVTRSQTFRSLMNLTAHVMDFQLRVFNDQASALQAIEVTMLKDDMRLAKRE